MNKTILIGNLTRDPRISMTSSGKRVAQVDIACNRAGRDGQQTADYYQISFWEERTKLAETLHKGDKILVEGRLTARGYQGKDGTIRAALEAILDYGRPKTVELLVLVDRGHRELPIHGDYVGRKINTARSEKVNVLMEERDGRDEVVLESADA